MPSSKLGCLQLDLALFALSPLKVACTKGVLALLCEGVCEGLGLSRVDYGAPNPDRKSHYSRRSDSISACRHAALLHL